MIAEGTDHAAETKSHSCEMKATVLVVEKRTPWASVVQGCREETISLSLSTEHLANIIQTTAITFNLSTSHWRILIYELLEAPQKLLTSEGNRQQNKIKFLDTVMILFSLILLWLVLCGFPLLLKQIQTRLHVFQIIANCSKL